MGYEFEVKKYSKTENGVYLQVFVPDKKILNDIFNFNKELKITSGEIKLDDGRLITAKQKKRIYLTIKDIADYLGYYESEMEQILVNNFNVSQNEELDLIPKASISVARKFIAYLLEFVLKFDIQLSDYALNRIENLDTLVYLCLKYKRCTICGTSNAVDIHHWDRIQMGNNRNIIDDSNHKKIALCRKCHTIAHNLGNIEFEKRYKVHGIIYNNKTIGSD